VQLEIKFKSIAVRWFFNMFLIVALIVSTVIIAFSVFFSSVYTERVEVMAGDLTYEFNSLSSATPKSFKDKAVELAGDFQYKTKLEVQVIDRHDNIIVTTTGFQPTDQRMPDYERAKKNGETAAAKRKRRKGFGVHHRNLRRGGQIYGRLQVDNLAERREPHGFGLCACACFGGHTGFGILRVFRSFLYKFDCKAHKGRKQYCKKNCNGRF